MIRPEGCTGEDNSLCQSWVAHHVPHFTPNPSNRCVAFMDGDELCGVVVTGWFYREWGHADVTTVMPDKRAFTRGNIVFMLRYWFEQLGLRRINFVTTEDNKRAQMMNEWFGAKYEGTLREYWNGTDALVYGLLRNDGLALLKKLETRHEKADAVVG